MKENKRKKSTKYLLIGTLVLFLSVLGASVAYYLARVQGNLSGRAAGTELAINVEKLSSNATGDLIPLDNDLETLQLAAAGYQDKGACIDINGYSVCQIYHITLTNNGSVPLTVNGTVTLSGQNVPNIDCARMNSSTEVANNNSCMGGNVFVSGDTLAANSSNDYYVMVYINNLDEPQTDSGAFNGVVTFTTEDGKKVKGRFTKPFNLVKHIEELYDLNGGTIENKTAKTIVTNNEIQYNYATNVGLMNDRLGGTTTSLDGGNIRYYGAEPNNYIDIGDKTEVATEKGNWETIFAGMINSSQECLEFVESQGLTDIGDLCSTTTIPAGSPILWRIIGVFDGKVRIVRGENIGAYSWDTSPSNINGGYGINEWSQADLMKLLNPGYENNSDKDCEGNNITVNNSLYWTSGSGKCYSGSSYTNIDCDFTNTGLSDEAKEYVVDQTLYLGGFDEGEIILNHNASNNTNYMSNESFTIERSNNIIQNPSDGVTRTSSWTGKVGLPYPSDLGYAADFRNENCNGNLGTYDSCTDNWLNMGMFSWFISPYIHYSSTGLIIGTGGVAYFDGMDNSLQVNPTLLLDSSVLAESGNGSKETPYVLTQ